MNHTPHRPPPKSATPVLLLFLGITALAAGLASLVAVHSSTASDPGTAATHETEVEEARSKADKVQEAVLPAPRFNPAQELSPRAWPAPGPGTSPASIRQASRSIDPDQGSGHARYEPVKAVAEVRPAYPSQARAARIQGPVEVLVKVDARGRPAEIEAVSGPAPLRRQAVEAAQGWRFTPARAHGRAVSAPYAIHFDFRLV
jgi:TonB family protein